MASRRKALAFEKWAQTFAPVPDDTTLEELSPAIVSEIVSLVLEDGQGGRSSVDRVARFFPEEDIGVASADGPAGLVRLLELVLVCAVQGDQRSNYIAAIQELETATQEQLMLSISENMQGYQKPEDESAAVYEEDKTAQEEQQKDPEQEDKELPALIEEDEVQELQIRARRLERENDALKTEMAQLMKEVKQANAEKASAEDETTKHAKHISAQSLRAEVDAFNKENELRQSYEEQLDSKQNEIVTLQTKLASVDGLESEVTKLRDEVDLLQPMAKKAERAEEQVAKYRAKLEQLEHSKQHIKGLENQNQELLAEKLRLGAELESVSVVKQQVDEYKQQVVDAEMRVSELTRKLRSTEHATESMSSRVDDLRGRADEETMANADLLEKIRRLEGELEDYKAGRGGMGMGVGGLGEGMTDLNPEVVSKMAHLEHENEKLKGMLSAESREHLVSLEGKLDDCTRLKDSFERRLGDTMDKLEATEATLAKTEGTLRRAEAESAERQARADRLEDELKEQTEARARAEARGEELDEALAKLQGEYEEEQAGRAEDVRRLEAEVEAAKAAAKADAESAAAEMERVEQEHKKEAEEAEEEREQERSAHAARAMEVAEQAEAQVKKAREEQAEAVTQLEAEKVQALGKVREEMEDFKRAHSVSDQEHQQQLAQFDAQRRQHEQMIERGKRKLNELAAGNELLEKKNARLTKERNYLSSKLNSNQKSQQEQESDASVDLANLAKEHKLLVARYERVERKLRRYEDGSMGAVAGAAAGVGVAGGVAGMAGVRGGSQAHLGALVDSVRGMQSAGVINAAGGSVGGASVGSGSGVYHSMRQQEAHQARLEKQKQEIMLEKIGITQQKNQLAARVNKLEMENSKLQAEKNSLQLKIMRGEKMLKQIQKSQKQQDQQQAQQPQVQPQQPGGKENEHSNSSSRLETAWPIKSKGPATAPAMSNKDMPTAMGDSSFNNNAAAPPVAPARRTSSYIPSRQQVGMGMAGGAGQGQQPQDGPGECSQQ